MISKSFPDSSVVKESSCNAGDPCWIPGSGRFAGERRGYPLQYSWVSIVPQQIRNSPTMWKTWVQSQGQEDLLEKEMATHFSILDWRIPRTEEPCGLQSRGLTGLDMTEATWHAWSRLDFSTQLLVSGRKDCSKEAQCMRDGHYAHHFCSHSTGGTLDTQLQGILGNGSS